MLNASFVLTLAYDRFVSRICIPTSQPSVLFSGSADGTVRVWRYVVGELLHTEDLKRGDAEKRIVTLPVAFSDEKQTLVVLVEGYAPPPAVPLRLSLAYIMSLALSITV
jgi:WD40 repeat protein